MPTRYLTIPLAVWAALAFYWSYEYGRDYVVWIVPPVVGMAMLYVLGPQINWWFWQRYPPIAAGMSQQRETQ